MLTLQQLLESDSISTIVAKLNQNFQSVSLANGGPQGIRGSQGVPGLPGRLGPTGPTGEQGPTGTLFGIIPFAATDSTGSTLIGPSQQEIPSIGIVGPWPYSSWEWLQYYRTEGGVGFQDPAPIQGDIYVDHANQGYWKYLQGPDIKGASNAGYTQGGLYSYVGDGAVYPYLGTTGGYAGDGWYFYPTPPPNLKGFSATWSEDFTTYLVSNLGGVTGPYMAGPYTDNLTSPLLVPNARLTTKYGTVWISSGNAGSVGNDDSNLTTPNIGTWGSGPGVNVPQPARNNAGIDRLLFKMSIDGLPYVSNVAARGFTGFFPGQPASPDVNAPADSNGDQMAGSSYFPSPQYNVSLDKFTPLMFFSHRDDADSVEISNNYGSLGLYIYTDTADYNSTLPSQPTDPWGSDTTIVNDNVAKSLHIFSTRYSPDPLTMYDVNEGYTPINSAETVNYGEMIMDVRRLIASNQYVCAVPSDTLISSETTNTAGGGLNYTESSATSFAYKTFQGYISAINGKAMTGDPAYGDYWEYGLGSNSPTGGGTHDAASGTAGMRTRRSWYGTSVLATKPSEWNNGSTQPGENDYSRIAGMMERGRRVVTTGLPGYTGATGDTATYFLSELMFYTSQFNLAGTAGVTNDSIDPAQNAQNSLPALYVSPFRNIGIGTFVGGNFSSGDAGPAEPVAKFHVHVKESLTNLSDPTLTFKQLEASATAPFSYLPTKVYSAGAFSSDESGQGVTDLLLGNLSAPAQERVNPDTNIVNDMQNPLTGEVMRNAVRSESWSSSLLNTLRLGAQPFDGINGATASIGGFSPLAFKNEFQFAIHPLTAFATDLTNSNNAIAGVGIHNMYPRARFHIYGKNLYNETEFGQEKSYPGFWINGQFTPDPATYKFPTNSPSQNQITIDYIGDSYTYPVGIKEYQYFAFGATSGISSTGSFSPNAAVYPSRDAVSPTRHAVPYGGVFNNNLSYPSTDPNVVFNGSYKHGGTANAWWSPSSFIGFNLFRDVSSASGGISTGQNTEGDDRDSTRWVIGTNGVTGSGSNGAAAIMFSPLGELGIVTMPQGRDGGNGYGQWEQRGIGTRDVLNNIKFLFDKRGNLGIGNAAGMDFDAYPSLWNNMSDGKRMYVNKTNNLLGPFVIPPGSAGPISVSDGYTAGYWNQWGTSSGKFGNVSYGSETESSSRAAAVNLTATEKESIRLEVAAEKGWTWDGREATKTGWGYPVDLDNYSVQDITNYVFLQFSASNNTTGVTPDKWFISTDSEGRIDSSKISFTGPDAPTLDWTDIASLRIFYPHPTEFNSGGPQNPTNRDFPGFAAPSGAIAAEWWGMSTDYPYESFGLTINDVGPIFWGKIPPDDPESPFFKEIRLYHTSTVDGQGAANIRLNNFVYGEGFGFGAGEQEDFTALSGTSYRSPDSYTRNLVRSVRQESPKIILSFLEKTPASRENTLTAPFLKVNTVIASAQNESPLREFYIPKADNTGATFMVFTDHMGSKEKDSGFDKQLTQVNSFPSSGTGAGGNIAKLILLNVVTSEIVKGAVTGSPLSITGATGNRLAYDDGSPLNMGFVNYYNRQNLVYDAINTLGGTTGVFASNGYGFNRQIASLGNTASITTGPGGLTAAPGLSAIDGADLNVPTYRYQNVVVDRNVEKYYNIWVGTTGNYAKTNRFGGAYDMEDNRATEIRFKRINSEYVLVDFNITVSVNNPVLPGGTTTTANPETDPTFGAANYIDNMSPRMTQYMSFTYSVDSSGNDLTESMYGNGPWFSNWSTFNHWIAGSAVSSGATDFTGDATLGAVNSPKWQGTTWNGNFIDPVSNLAQYGTFPFNDYSWNVDNVDAFGSYEDSPGNPIRPRFSAAPLNMQISNQMAGAGGTQYNPTTEFGLQSRSFIDYKKYFHSSYGNMAFSRVRPMMWRMSPYRYAPTLQQGDNTPNNTFLLEVMFDTPIMHTYHYLNASMYGATYPYKYLTVTGQSILRYSASNNKP